jgi:hypothetical protein
MAILKSQGTSHKISHVSEHWILAIVLSNAFQLKLTKYQGVGEAIKAH